MPRKGATGRFAQADFRRRFRRKLLAWYRRHARDLPWRRTRDPYAVWVSEVMLQQTQVSTVVPYYERFLARFPSLAALAAADEQEVLRLWEGLGYYRRARQLHRAAQLIVAEHGGRFPRDAAALRRLPGIGRYTAGAILSIAFDARQPVLEANTLRLWTRLLAHRGDPRAAAGQALLWGAAESILPRRGTGTLNQALMELGAEVCLPRSPRCDACPVADFCQAKTLDLQQRVSASPPRPRIEHVKEAAVVILRQGKVLLVQRGEHERWAGMWDFPRFELTDAANGDLPRLVVARVREITGVEVQGLASLTTIRHGVTRFRITLNCYTARCQSAARRRRDRPMHWVAPDALPDYPLSTTGRKIARLLDRSLSPSRLCRAR